MGRLEAREDRSGVEQSKSRLHGFSLVELLTVVAVVSVMATLIGPVLLSGGPSRSGAAQSVMGIMEQARAASLQGMGRIYVVFSQGATPERDAMMVFRANDGEVEQITRWTDLPRGVILHSLPGVPECVVRGNLNEVHEAWASWQELPQSVRSRPGRLSILAFNTSGALEESGNGDALVVIAEGHRDAIGPGATLKTPDGAEGIFDVVAVASFSGRPYYFTARSSDLADPGE